MTETRKPRVALIGTGGTISSLGRDSLDVWQYMDHGKKVEADELVERFPVVALTRTDDVLEITRMFGEY